MYKLFTSTGINTIMKGVDIIGTLNGIHVAGSFDVIAAQAKKTLEETEHHNAFVVNADSIGYTFGDDDRPERITKAFFAATSEYLSRTKIRSEDEATALVLMDVSGNFKFAGIVKFNLNKENPDEPGNWEYTMTLNEADITKLEETRKVKKLLYGDQAFLSIFDKVAYDVASIQFEQERFMYDACLLTIDTIVQILDNEAVNGEQVNIEMPGYFVATVETENDEKVFALTPDGHMKAIIKKDADLDVVM